MPGVCVDAGHFLFAVRFHKTVCLAEVGRPLLGALNCAQNHNLSVAHMHHISRIEGTLKSPFREGAVCPRL